MGGGGNMVWLFGGNRFFTSTPLKLDPTPNQIQHYT